MCAARRFDSIDDTLALARKIRETSGVVLHGILAYEAQVAGMGDDSPFEARTNFVKRWIRSASVEEINESRGPTSSMR